MDLQDRSLSVILPNYNHGRYLERAIAALLAQEPQPREILIIDDGSTDDSAAVIERLLRQSSRLRALHNVANMGLVPTQRRGLDVATGAYVYLAAADDWVLPGFFNLAIGMLEAHPRAGLFFGEAVLVDGACGKTLGFRPAAMPQFHAGWIASSRVRRMLKRSDNWIVTGASVLRREAVGAAGGLDPELGSFADSYLTRKIALTRGALFAPQVVATWCIHPGSESRQSARTFDKARHMLDLAPRKIAADPAFPRWYARRYGMRWRFATARLAIGEPEPDLAFVSAMGGYTLFDRRVIALISALSKGAIRKIGVLFWLWLRLRPYRVTHVLATALYRRLWPRYRSIIGVGHREPAGRDGATNAFAE